MIKPYFISHYTIKIFYQFICFFIFQSLYLSYRSINTLSYEKVFHNKIAFACNFSSNHNRILYKRYGRHRTRNPRHSANKGDSYPDFRLGQCRMDARSRRSERHSFPVERSRHCLLYTSRLLPLRYAYMRFDGGDDAPQFDALRAFVAEKASVAQMMCDTSAEYSAPCTAFRNHLWVGHMFEQMICVEDAEGYGYVDTQNRYLIAPQYRWANDFHEGRAEVQTADGRMGLIDKTGRYVLEPHYEIVEYDDRTGRLLARLDGRWAAFDYEGRQLTEFGAVEP